MGCMKYRRLVPFLFLLANAHADEAAMKQALSVWEQEMVEYRAAQEFAKTPEQRAQLPAPDGLDVAASLWQAISAKTGEREETVQPGYAERKKGAKPATRKIPTYEFEQEWALPAVVWFVCHPQAFVKALENKPRQQAYFSEALLDSIKRIHFRAPGIAPACAKLAEGTTSQVYDILEKIYLHNQDAAARSNAALGMSLMLGNPLLAGTTGSANTRAKRVYYLKQALTLAPDDAMFGDFPFHDIAGELTYNLRYLSVGSIPPQIKVRRLDGKDELLPQPGKAHLLFFWSPQDEAGAEAVRHMQAAQDRYPDLVICPVIPYQEEPGWSQQMEQKGISDCYMDDEQGTAARSYRLRRLPTAVLLSDRCRILYIGEPGLQLQTSIDTFFHSPSGTKGARKGKIIIGGEEEAPAIQLPAHPTPADSQAPALRDMPEL